LYLFNSGVALNVNLPAAINLNGNAANSVQSEVAHQVVPTADKLCSDRSLDKVQHLLLVVDVDGDRDVVNNLDSVFQGLLQGSNDDNGVNVALEVREGLGKNLSS